MWIHTLIFTSLLLICSAYDNDDYEIFDLVEEVKENFYTLLSISQDASVAEVRRAYRKLSLQLHPDKNDAPDAEEKFRQLVAVYDVLKDSAKREKYNLVLQNGLPDWRQATYYYRKYRKMGFMELSICISLISTIGHILFRWTAYLEKKFEVDELLEPVRRRMQKKKAKKKAADDEEDISTDQVIEEQYGYTRPTFWDLLPFVIYRGVTGFIISIPSKIRNAKQRYQEDQEEKQRLKEEEEAAAAAELVEEEKKKEKKEKKKPVSKIRDISEMDEFDQDYVPGMHDANGDLPGVETTVAAKRDGEWTEEDYAALAKAMAKFPGGTPGRWDRIAHDIGRTAKEVTSKVKEMKVSLAKNLPVAGSDQVIGGKKRAALNLSDSMITKAIDSELSKTTIISDSMLYSSQDDIPDDYDQGFAQEEEPVEVYTEVRKRKVKTRPPPENPEEKDNAETKEEEKATEETQKQKENATNTTQSEKENKNQTWSQVQQKCLEAAIAQFPKSTQDRWTCIARAVPGKNKEECIARYKLLVEHIKQKKQTKDS